MYLPYGVDERGQLVYLVKDKISSDTSDLTDNF
jgi:hypothetical protein